MSPAPLELETARLKLREFSADDAAFVLRLLNEPSFIEFIGDRGVRTLTDAERYLRNGPMASYRHHGHGLLRVSLKDGDIPVGMCGLVKRDTLPAPDIGFALLPDFWGRGYVTEAAEAVLEHGEHAESKEVDLDEADGVEVVLLPLNDGAVLHARGLDGDDGAQRLLGEDEAADVDAAMSWCGVELFDDVGELLDAWVAGVEVRSFE